MNSPDAYSLVFSTCIKSTIRLIGYLILLSILTDIIMRRPFLEKNVKRFRFLGWGALVYALYGLAEFLFKDTDLDHVGKTLLAFSDTDVFEVLMLSLCLFALAEVFKHGLVLRQEQDLTV